MPNIASALRSEISRVARKEVRVETEALKKSSVQQRAHIATLRRQVLALERDLKRVRKAAPAASRAAAAPTAGGDGGEAGLRFRSAGLASLRRKLGLSAKDMGALIGVSGLSVYKWESGKVRPRAAQLQAIAAVRGIGKRAAAQRLEALAHPSKHTRKAASRSY